MCTHLFKITEFLKEPVVKSIQIYLRRFITSIKSINSVLYKYSYLAKHFIVIEWSWTGRFHLKT